MRKDMRRTRILLSFGFAMLLTLAGCANNPQKTKVVWIAKDGNVSRSYEVSNEAVEQRFPEPGDVILFRTTEALSPLGSGKAGEAYEVDEAKRLRKIGEFALTKTDEELVKEYQKR